MGLYSRYVFPWIMDFVMSRKNVMAERAPAVSRARGEVLEIGFGTGLNLPCYGEGVTSLTALDPSVALRKRVHRRVARVPFPVKIVVGDAASLPFESGRFDCVVTTFTMCSVPDPAASLAEIRRVLKEGGKYYFLEHGQSDDPKVARRQERWNGLQQLLAGGCHLNRQIDRLIATAGLQIARLDRHEMAQAPRTIGALYVGEAVVSFDSEIR